MIQQINGFKTERKLKENMSNQGLINFKKATAELHPA